MAGNTILIVSLAALSTGMLAEKWAAPRLRGRFLETGHPADEADDRAIAFFVAGVSGLAVGGFAAWVVCSLL